MEADNRGREYRYQADWSVGTRMFHVRCDYFTEFQEACVNMETMLPQEKPFPDDQGNKATAPSQAAGETPLCPVHGTAMKWHPPGISKAGKHYKGFWGCGTKNEDGSWCNVRPVV